MVKDKTPASELKELLNQLLPPINSYNSVIDKEQQIAQLNLLNENIVNENFYFVFNLLSCELENTRGVAEWLGYSDNEFTVNRYLNCVHPHQHIQHNIFAYCMYKTLCKGMFKLQFSKQKYISLVGLKHYNGEYIVFKKITSVFQYDDKNRLLAQLNEFNKLGVYDGESLKPRIAELNGLLQKDDFEKVIFPMVLQTFMKKDFFSEREINILKNYTLHQSIHTNELAQLMHLDASTIDTYNKRILAKARETFTRHFNNAKEVALYLKQEKML